MERFLYKYFSLSFVKSLLQYENYNGYYMIEHLDIKTRYSQANNTSLYIRVLGK